MEITNADLNSDIQNPMQVFILSGQSNMAGRGSVTKYHHSDGVVPHEFQPHPSILRFSANLHGERAREPLHADIDTKKTYGVGPGMSFGNTVRACASALEERLGLVPCAVGGTSIKEWACGEKLYDDMVMRSKDSVKSGGGEIKALMWYQSESDTMTLHDANTMTLYDAEAYQLNIETLINNVRQDLHLPSLPIIRVALASGYKYIKKVREAQLGINLRNVVCVDARGLHLKEDHLHLTTETQVKLGRMMAEAYLKHFAR